MKINLGQNRYDKYLDYDTERINHIQFLYGKMTHIGNDYYLGAMGYSYNEGHLLQKGSYDEEELSRKDLFDWFSYDERINYGSLVGQFEYNIPIFDFIYIGITSKINLAPKRTSFVQMLHINLIQK